MTAAIVAPEQADADAPRPALPSLTMPAVPQPPSGAELAAAVEAAAGRMVAPVDSGVPTGVNAGPTDAADVLDWLVAPIEAIRRKLAQNDAGGFLVTAADLQRHGEVTRLTAEIARILAERA